MSHYFYGREAVCWRYGFLLLPSPLTLVYALTLGYPSVSFLLYFSHVGTFCLCVWDCLFALPFTSFGLFPLDQWRSPLAFLWTFVYRASSLVISSSSDGFFFFWNLRRPCLYSDFLCHSLFHIHSLSSVSLCKFSRWTSIVIFIYTDRTPTFLPYLAEFLISCPPLAPHPFHPSFSVRCFTTCGLVTAALRYVSLG